jgi:hypothetical protein
MLVVKWPSQEVKVKRRQPSSSYRRTKKAAESAKHGQILGGRIGAADSANEDLAADPTYSGGARVLATTLRR